LIGDDVESAEAPIMAFLWLEVEASPIYWLVTSLVSVSYLAPGA